MVSLKKMLFLIWFLFIAVVVLSHFVFGQGCRGAGYYCDSSNQCCSGLQCINSVCSTETCDFFNGLCSSITTTSVSGPVAQAQDITMQQAALRASVHDIIPSQNSSTSDIVSSRLAVAPAISSPKSDSPLLDLSGFFSSVSLTSIAEIVTAIIGSVILIRFLYIYVL
jgi:hypothetical protein